MSFASDLLPDLDAIRGIPGELGTRPFAVTVRVRRWSGERVGDGYCQDEETPLFVGGSSGAQNPKVKQVAQRDIIASGNLYQALDLRVGPLTPPYPGGGVAPATLDPATSASPTEIFWNVTGPGLPDGGAWFSKVSSEYVSALHEYIVLRANGRDPGPKR